MEIRLSESIREETKTYHQALEKQVNQHLKAISSRDDYVYLLSCFYAYFHDMEVLLNTYISPEILPDIAARRKAYLILDDIRTSGLTLYPISVNELPRITSPLEAMAALYVLEGSTLGGTVIAKILERKNIGSGLSFFQGYGPETGVMWMKFLNVLDQMPAGKESRPAAIRAAQQTFECFRTVFAENYRTALEN